MQIPSTSPEQVSQEYSVRVARKAMDATNAEGEAALQLIEQTVPPVGPQGQGTHVNTYG